MKLYHNCSILTMDGKGTSYPDGALVIENDKIIDVGNRKELTKKYQDAEKINLKGRLVMPGLINNHIHLAQSLFRGFSDDMTIEPWLFKRIWPLQSAHDRKTFLAGARLAMLEMSLSGTTTFVESMIVGYGLEELLEETRHSRMRARLAKVVMEPKKGSALPKELTENFEDSLEEARQVRQKIEDREKLDIWLAPRWTGMYNPPLLEKVNQVMDDEGFCSTIHFAEEKEDLIPMLKDGYSSPGDFLRKKGLLDRNYLLIHCTSLHEGDTDIMRKGKATLAHCPVSSMKMAMGYLDVPGMLASGVKVGIGTDGASCNNANDLLSEIKVAALLHKHQQHLPDLLPAEAALALGTRTGAESIFAGNLTGTLEAGKKADFITLDQEYAAPIPEYNLTSAAVYALTGRDVRDVFVDGVSLVRDGLHLVYDQEKIRADARQAMNQLRKRTGL